MHQQHDGKQAASGDEDDGRQRKPPAPNRLRYAEERSYSERQKDDGGKNDEGQDAVESSQGQHSQGHAGLQQDSVGRRTKAGMKACKECQRTGSIPLAVASGFLPCQRVSHTRHSHAQDHESAKDAQQHAG